MAADDDKAGTGAPASLDETYRRVSAALADHDKATAVGEAVEAVSRGSVTIQQLYGLLHGILSDTGAAWQTGKTAIWEEHLASSTVRTIVEILYPGVLKAKAEVEPAGRTVLLACPPEEGHDLGLRMVSDRFDMAGWTTYFLGPDTPVDEIADAAARLGVDAVVMSSSTHYHRLAVRHAVDALKKRLPGVDVWVGGPAFVGAATGWLPEEIVNIDELLEGKAGRGPEEASSPPEAGGEEV